MAKKQWYKMAAIAQGEKTVAEIRIYDEIGFWGMTAKDFVTELDAVAAGASEIVVSINSPGGDVFDAFAIYNALRRHPLAVTTRVDGIAASAASLILMAGNTVLMPENAMIMIHNAWTIAAGTADELRNVAVMMDKARDGIVAAYTTKTGKSADEIIELMNATTWMTALDAQALGFCDVIEEPIKLAASASMAAILAKHKGVPEELLVRIQPPAESEDAHRSTEPAAAAGAASTVAVVNTAALAAHVFAGCADMPAMAEAVLLSGGLESEAAADSRIGQAKEMAGLCLAAKVPEKAPDFVKAGLSVDQVRARLFDHVIEQAAGSISNLQRPGEHEPARSGPNAHSIYAARMALSHASK